MTCAQEIQLTCNQRRKTDLRRAFLPAFCTGFIQEVRISPEVTKRVIKREDTMDPTFYLLI